MQPKDPQAGITEIPAESRMKPGSLDKKLTVRLQTWSGVRRTRSCLGEIPRPKIRIPMRSREVPGLAWAGPSPGLESGCLCPAGKGVQGHGRAQIECGSGRAVGRESLPLV